MHLKLITPPGGEPVSVEEAKRYLRVEADEDQEIIANLITTARLAVESYTGRNLMTQTWRLTLHQTNPALSACLISPFNRRKATIKLPGNPFICLQGHPKLVSQSAEWEIKDYHVVKGLSQALLGLHGLSLNETQSLQVDFRCGYGDSPEEVPLTFRQAILMLVAELYDNRNGQSSHPTQPAFINDAVACLLEPLRCLAVI
ncbi:MAG: phage head-tail connector protein [Alphaproteobacteria bacterium]|nr:phage head-tail connector protein [Alphaproteobacteria bacterium]